MTITVLTDTGTEFELSSDLLLSIERGGELQTVHANDLKDGDRIVVGRVVTGGVQHQAKSYPLF